MIDPADLYRDPNCLAGHYSRFRVADRLLLTGHSHQAWPDCAFTGQQQAWLDAAELVDDKWPRAFEVADRVRTGFARLLGGGEGHIALAPNTHDLVVRFLSALPLTVRPRLVTTGGEFHTIRRQLERLAEEGLDVVAVPVEPVADLAERMASQVDDRTAAVLVSAVLFESARIVPGLGDLQQVCAARGAELLVDAYHAVNVLPFSLADLGLERSAVVGGGYKYCQLGEGNCFMRLPADCQLRPVITGWFSEFSALADADRPGSVPYGRGPDRFAGSTYDPTSHYRASAVFDFFADRELTPELLRAVSQHQIGVLAAAFDELDADPELIDRDRALDLTEVAGFLAVRSRHAARLVAGLRERGVLVDARGSTLRLGPAPYLCDRQLVDAVGLVGEALRSL